MDIDVVYTWVNHKDKEWQKLYRQALQETSIPNGAHKSVHDIGRFQNRNELYYSIKSVRKYAPWVRKIFVVTNCKLPEWAEADSGIVSVSHEEIFLDISVLPTFNSHAIEANLHRISALAERFLYFNDDFFLCQPVSKNDFFSKDGKAYLFPCKHDIPYKKTTGLRPIDYAALNACRLLVRDYQFTPQKKLHHSPYPLLKNTLIEIENKYGELLRSTSSHKFREDSDLPLATTLHAYYSLVNGYTLMKHISSRYIDIGDPLFVFLVLPFSPLHRGKYKTLCFNEVSGIRCFRTIRDWIVLIVLKDMFR